jgi:hypothetical protein
MKLKIKVPRPIGGILLLAVAAYAVWWAATFIGSSGELTPRSRARVLVPILMNGAINTQGYVWARPGDTIVLEYEVELESGYFNLTIGKSRWWSRTLLRDEESRSLRKSGEGQLRYTVVNYGLHKIWAGTYSVWKGHARVRWSRVSSEQNAS